MTEFAALRRWSLPIAVLCLLSLGGYVRAQDATPSPALAEQIGINVAIPDALSLYGALGDSRQFEAYGHRYRLIVIWEVASGSIIGPVEGAVLLYQLDIPALIWSQDFGKLRGQVPYLSTDQMPASGDWNNDGQIEFGVFGSRGGTAWYSTMYYIYQLLPDNTVVSALEGTIPPGMIVTNIETDVNNNLLLTAEDVSGELTMGLANCCGPHIGRYYAWRDGNLVDVSPEHVEKYTQPLGYAIYTVTTQPITDGAEFSARLLEILEMYEAIGQKEAGWMLAQNLVAQAKASGRLQDGTYVDTVFVPTMKQLYDSSLPFIVPDLTATPQDFYAE